VLTAVELDGEGRRFHQVQRNADGVARELDVVASEA